VTNLDLYKDGKPASLGMINHTLHAVDIQALTPTVFEPSRSTRPTSKTPSNT
jgi:hypothetical protein